MASAYTQAQASQFLGHIQIPQRYHLENNPPRDIAFLTALHTHFISTIPYDNLTIHYSREHAISIEPQHLFQKFITDRLGRGGYCMENSLFYAQILRALGFRAYPVACKIRLRIDGIPQGDYLGWTHIVNIVTLSDSSRWSVDVGFGGDGATKPLPLIPDHITPNIGTQELRLTRDFLPTQTERTPGLERWIYQYRNAPQNPWNSFYSFSDAFEFSPIDFEAMNFYTSAHPQSFQTRQVLVVKFLRRLKEGSTTEQEVYGKRMLVDGVVKENLGGRTRVVERCRTEKERVEALERWFGICFSEEEREAIRGWRTELKG